MPHDWRMLNRLLTLQTGDTANEQVVSPRLVRLLGNVTL